MKATSENVSWLTMARHTEDIYNPLFRFIPYSLLSDRHDHLVTQISGYESCFIHRSSQKEKDSQLRLL